MAQLLLIVIQVVMELHNNNPEKSFIQSVLNISKQHERLGEPILVLLAKKLLENDDEKW